MKSLAVGFGDPRFWPTMTLFFFDDVFPRTQLHGKNKVTLLHYKGFISTIDLNFETGFLFRILQLVTSMRSQGNWDWRLGIPVWWWLFWPCAFNKLWWLPRKRRGQLTSYYLHRQPYRLPIGTWIWRCVPLTYHKKKGTDCTFRGWRFWSEHGMEYVYLLFVNPKLVSLKWCIILSYEP